MVKTLTVGDSEFIVSDAVAHHIPTYWHLLYSLGRTDHGVPFPAHTEAGLDQIVTVNLHRAMPAPRAADYVGPLGELTDPDDLTDVLENTALELLSDMGTLYSHASADWCSWLDERSRQGKPIPPLADPD